MSELTIESRDPRDRAYEIKALFAAECWRSSTDAQFSDGVHLGEIGHAATRWGHAHDFSKLSMTTVQESNVARQLERAGLLARDYRSTLPVASSDLPRRPACRTGSSPDSRSAHGRPNLRAAHQYAASCGSTEPSLRRSPGEAACR